MNTDELASRARYLIDLGKSALAINKTVFKYGGTDNTEEYSHFRNASLSFIQSLYGKSHPYYEQFKAKVDRPYNPTEVNFKIHTEKSINFGIGIIKALKDEIEKGWLDNIKDLIQANIFSDFLEMAEYLLSEGYKDAAAVITGSVLEQHIIKLCKKNGLYVTQKNKRGKDIPKKASRLNSDLYSNKVYDKLYQKNITAWLDLRNKAAHGHYNDYNVDQIKIMHLGISEFINRHK